jgi:hypothetical protein
VLQGEHNDVCSPPAVISIRFCLLARIDRGKLRLNHFVDKLAKSSPGLPAKFFANLVRATDQSRWFCGAIKRPIMPYVFLPWKVNKGESRLDKFAH